MKIKAKYTLLLLVISLGSLAQSIDKTKIDSNNYYSFYSNGKNLKGSILNTSWLNVNDVVPIILEEMKLAGHEWLYDHSIFKIDTNKYIKLAAYSRKSNFGFLYIEGHNSDPKKEHRHNLTQKKQNKWGAEYISCIETENGSADFVPILKLPPNIFVLNENCYWYQFTDNTSDNKRLITKEDMIKILRQDIKKYLLNAPRPK